MGLVLQGSKTENSGLKGTIASFQGPIWPESAFLSRLQVEKGFRYQVPPTALWDPDSWWGPLNYHTEKRARIIV